MDDNAKTNRQKRRQKKRTQWEKLRQSPIVGITTLESGGLVSTPISGKALGGRIGRRIGGGNSGPQDMNPMTARDSDLDGMVLEGIPTIRQGRGVPDPTPGSDIAGNMAREHNKDEFVGLPQLLRQHFAQFVKFQEWTRNKDWRAFHRNHFDWWMFPIPRGSNSYQDKYNIAGEPLEELKNNMRYMSTLPAAMRMYLRSIGWDLDAEKWIEDADINNGQEPLRSLNSARLYKIAQSAEAHELLPELRSVGKMVNDLRRNGVAVGNEQYWNGIAGKMAGEKRVDYDKDFPKWDRSRFGDTWRHPNGDLYAFNGMPTGRTNGWQLASTFFDLRQVPDGEKTGDVREFTAADKATKAKFKWDGSRWIRHSKTVLRRDKASGGGAAASLNSERRPDKAQNLALRPGTEKFKEFFQRLDMLFDWRDETARDLMVRRHRAKPGHEEPDSLLYHVPPLKADTANDLYKDMWSFLRPLGIWIEKRGGGHENVGAGKEKWFEQPSTPGDINSNIVSFSKLLQHLNEDVNPELFFTHFENWIRNPYSVVRTPSGESIGVRAYYKDDREQLLAEYRRRVADLYIAAFARQGESPPERILQSAKQNQVNDWLEMKRSAPYVNNLLTEELTQILSEGITPRSKERLAALLSVRLQSRLTPDIIDMLSASDSLIETMLAENFPTRSWGRDEKFFTPDILPSGDDDTIDIVRELGEQFLYKIQQDTNEIPSEITDAMAEDFIALVGDESINRSAVKPFLTNVSSDISGNMGSISGKMAAAPERDTEATHLGYNPDVPEHLGNHFTSRHSGYDKRPEPVDTPAKARATGAPLKGLVPGDYHPDIQELINEMIDKVIEDNFHTQFQTTPLHYLGATSPEEIAAADRASDFRAFLGDWSARVQSKLMRLFDWSETDFELTDDHKFLLRGYLSDEDIAKITRYSQVPTTYTDRYGTHDMSVVRSLIGGQIPSLGIGVGSELQEISDGLAQRAIHAGLKINNLRRLNVSEIDRATDDTLEWWNDSLAAAFVVNNADEEIGGAWDSLQEDVNISIGMPLEGIMSMLRDGEFKTLFETRTSKGNSNMGARRVAEFAMFGILPSYDGKRPAYGIINYGPVTRDALDRTHQYGPFIIVLKKSVNESATWTESDSLSLMSSSSSLEKPSQHSLFQQRQTLDVPFLRIVPAWGGRGKPKAPDGPDAMGQFQFAEAQLHRPITVDDIAHIIIDTDAWYRAEQYINFPVTREDGFPIAETDPEYAEYERLYPQDLANYDGIIQISKIAASLNIPVLLTDELDAENGEEKYGPEYI